MLTGYCAPRWLGRFAVAALAAAAFLAPASALHAQTCGTTTWDLTAGQTIDVGSVTVSNDATNLYVTYALDYPGATFGTLHLWVGSDLANVPANPQGTPVPGQFPYKPDASGLTTYTITIPFTDLLIQDVAQACGLQLYVVAHAEVNVPDGEGGYDAETAFGGPNPGAGPRWWFYGVYTVCCEFGPPPVTACSTAFAKGGYVWTTDRKSNPESLPTLGLSKNRWGWAINLQASGTYTYDLWSGAGLNKTANGVKVGTVTVNWDGVNATVTYNVTAAGYLLDEVHVYAGDDAPATIAPGQYGNTAYLPGGSTSYTVTAPLADANGGGVWIVAHSVVCN